MISMKDMENFLINSILMKGILKMACFMVKNLLLSIKMDSDLLDTSMKEINILAGIYLLMEAIMKVNSKIIYPMVQEISFGQMESPIQVSGKIAYKMELD